jgi:hypothetical protein
MSLLSLSFWFNLRPGSMAQLYSYSLMGLIVLLFVLAIIFFVSKRKKSLYKKMLSNLYDFSVSNAFIGLLLLFFNYEIVPFFSARFWFLLWLIVSILWLYYILKELKKIPARKKQLETTDEIKKYLP